MPRSLRRPLTAVVAAHLGLLLAWTVLMPTFTPPDEYAHHDLVRYMTETWRYPSWDGLQVSRRSEAAAAGFPSEQVGRDDRPGWADLGPEVRDGTPSKMPMHPPLYYAAAGALVRVLDAHGTVPVDRVVWYLRLAGALAVAVVPLAAADIAWRLGRSRHAALGAAIAVAAVPQLTQVGASLSNDGLLIALCAVTLAGAVRLATGDRRWGVVTGTGVTAGLALLTKGFAVPLVPAVAVACLAPLASRVGWPSRGASAAAPGGRADAAHPSTRELTVKATVVALLAGLLGGWWWVRNVIVHGDPQPGLRLRERVPVDIDVFEFLDDFTDRLTGSFWGWFGGFEARLPAAVTTSATVGLVALVGVALAAAWPRRAAARNVPPTAGARSSPWVAAWVALLPTLVAGGMVVASGWGAYRKTGVSYATQGRYLFVGVAGLAALAVVGARRLARGRPQLVVAGAAGLAVGMQTLAGWTVLRHFWDGPGLADRIDSLMATAPLPGALTRALCAAGALGVLTIAGVGLAGLGPTARHTGDARHLPPRPSRAETDSVRSGGRL